MKKEYLKIDGIYAAYYPCKKASNKGMIAMLGDNIDDYLAKCVIKYLLDFNINVIALSPGKNNYDFANYPLENFGKLLTLFKERGLEKYGIIGASTTGMLSLIVASYYNDISLTIALSPSDFVMEGYHTHNRIEVPGDGESTVSYEGTPLDYLPFYYRGVYHEKVRKDQAVETKNLCAAKRLFDDAEAHHPITEKETIKTERINGTAVVIGAKDDILWDTCRYIERIKKRLTAISPRAQWHYFTYEYGTHLIFPESMMKKLVPFGLGTNLIPRIMFESARKHPKEVKETRKDLDEKLNKILKDW